jgi:cytoskeleton protein RodZ
MSETIGQQLKKAREARNLTFKKVTQSTHIQARLLEAMEADDFESMSSPVQARAFLRLYAEFLELSLDELIAHQRAGSEAPPVSLSKKPSAPVEALVEITPSKTKATPDKLVVINRTEIEAPVPVMVEEPWPPDKSSAQSRSQAIFTAIGKTLQERREALSLSMDEIEAHTHVRTHYLQALEQGDFDRLPSSVQTRGMLNNYAHFLNMDVDAILLKFAEGLQAQRLERQPIPVGKTRGSGVNPASRTVALSGWRRLLSMDVLVGGGLVLFLLVFAIWGTTRVIGLRSAGTPQPTTPPISDILASTPLAGTAIPVPTNQSGSGVVIPEVSSTAIVTVPAAGQGPVQVVLVALTQAFVRVTVDGKKLFDGRVTAGTAYPFNGNSQIEVLTGNGAAISITFNQSDLGQMGSIGEVVNRIYTKNAILNPTATLTPSPTITPTPTVTPRPSPTPRPGSTPRSPTATKG